VSDRREAPLRPLLDHFLAASSFSWLLLPHDWTQNERTQVYMDHCSLIVPARRWQDPGTPWSGKDNFVWLRFAAEHRGGPRQHVDGNPIGRTKACEWCGGSFIPTRADARYHNDACRQRAHRARLAVT
jgi:hypothetical protein